MTAIVLFAVSRGFPICIMRTIGGFAADNNCPAAAKAQQNAHCSSNDVRATVKWWWTVDINARIGARLGAGKADRTVGTGSSGTTGAGSGGTAGAATGIVLLAIERHERRSVLCNKFFKMGSGSAVLHAVRERGGAARAGSVLWHEREKSRILCHVVLDCNCIQRLRRAWCLEQTPREGTEQTPPGFRLGDVHSPDGSGAAGGGAGAAARGGAARAGCVLWHEREKSRILCHVVLDCNCIQRLRRAWCLEQTPREGTEQTPPGFRLGDLHSPDGSGAAGGGAGAAAKGIVAGLSLLPIVMASRVELAISASPNC